VGLSGVDGLGHEESLPGRCGQEAVAPSSI
jgi:hypothetical protein